MPKLENIHDKFFKKVFSNIENVKDFLRIALPADIQTHTNLDNINIDANSYVSDSVKEFYSDVVVKSCIKDFDTELDIYILFEHKSYQDKRIFIQLLHYMYLMWARDFENKKPLRIIIPLVFYHGKTQWKIPLNFLDQFKINDDLKKYLLDFSYILFDTNTEDFYKESNISLKNNVFLLTSLHLMKAAFNDDIETIRSVFDFWVDKDFITNTEQLLMFFIYISATKDTSLEKLEELLEESKIERRDIVPTLAQRLRQEGIEQGIEKGIEKGKLEGRSEGIEQGKIEIARNLLQKGMDTQFIAEITGLTKEQIEKLL